MITVVLAHAFLAVLAFLAMSFFVWITDPDECSFRMAMGFILLTAVLIAAFFGFSLVLVKAIEAVGLYWGITS